MSSYTFDPEDGPVVQNVTPDPTPEIAEDGPRCEVCGKPLEYFGRGRKPKRCEEHKRGGAAKKTAPRPSTRNAQLAADAAMALCNMHSMAAIGVNVVGYSDTGATIVAANDGFYEAARAALSTDPELCRRILNSGAGTGSVALVIAYGMFFSAVGPAFVNERREKVAEKRARLEAEGEAE